MDKHTNIVAFSKKVALIELTLGYHLTFVVKGNFDNFFQF
ncbi:protein of unknown function [Streptococcus thermophilus]|nr:protein of unknown function [Streptococcus thermophilus]CAD0124934.1 protein of unknown function [Streptococcus thermophilus]CAD0131174.1 protein of unknown function [Streptococcus thermophilus]CAD0133357.1 protein of unknown function [Streptococcus thermophilus]CAD0180923.1 protein of unknown function [Streptococcus thermophilus]